MADSTTSDNDPLFPVDERPTLMQERFSSLSDDHRSARSAVIPMEQPPIVGRELTALVLIVVLSDVTIYRGQGSAGFALFFTVAPLLLWL